MMDLNDAMRQCMDAMGSMVGGGMMGGVMFLALLLVFLIWVIGLLAVGALIYWGVQRTQR